MYVENCFSALNAVSTPEFWANNFQDSIKYNAWKALSIFMDYRWRLIRRYIPQNEDCRVLDAGCGFGEWVYHLNKYGYKSEGLDYSDTLISRLQQCYNEYKWTLGATTAMPYEDKSFNGVISWGVVEHDPHGPDGQLREFYRVLKPGGRVILTVPYDSPVHRKTSKIQFAGHGQFFQYFFTPDEFSRHLAAVGFKVIKTAPAPDICPALIAPNFYAKTNGKGLAYKMMRLATRLNPGITWRSNMIYAIAERCVD